MIRAEVEDDRITLHDLRGVNVKVDFFLDTEKRLYSICWDKVDIRVELCTFTEQISELDFFFSIHQLFIDDHRISGDVIDFRCEAGEQGVITAYCKIIVKWD
jgi:hypothetical protein